MWNFHLGPGHAWVSLADGWLVIKNGFCLQMPGPVHLPSFFTQMPNAPVAGGLFQGLLFRCFNGRLQIVHSGLVTVEQIINILIPPFHSSIPFFPLFCVVFIVANASGSISGPQYVQENHITASHLVSLLVVLYS